MSEKDSFLKKLMTFVERGQPGPHHSFWRVGDLRIHRLTDPKRARAVLQSLNTTLPSFAKKGLSQVIGNALIVNEGEEWRRKHALFKVLFSPSGVNRVVAPMVVPATDKMIDRWATGRPVDAEMEMRYHTGGTITRVMFTDSITEKQSRAIIEASTVEVNLAEPIPALTLLSRVFENASKDTRLGRFLAEHHEDVNKPSKELARGVALTEAIFDDIIDNRRRLAKQPEDVLGLMLGLKPALTDKEIKEELLEIVFAGHDTSSVTATMDLRELLKNPGEYEKLRREADRVTEGRNGRLEPEDFGKLPAARNAVFETLRLYPPAHRFARQFNGDEVLDGYAFKKNDLVLVDTAGMHRSPDHFSQPERFLPDRFNESAKPPPAWMPFSAGRHQCLGMVMATTVVTATTARIAQRLDIGIEQDVKGVKRGFTQRPDGKLVLKAKPRP